MKKPTRNLLNGTKTTESKLTKASLVLEYAFEYNVNFRERTILISGTISQNTFEIVDAAFTEMEADSRKAITVKINSSGGEVYQALAIVGRMRRSHCHVVTEGYGHIMSAATLILAAGDKRKVSKYTFFMHHESSYKVTGKHSDVKNEVAQAELEEQSWAQWMHDLTKKKDKKWWLKTGTGKDAYFLADQLIDLGVADEVF